MKDKFLPSMTEVEFGDYYKDCAKGLYGLIQNFHVDFGDGLFIERVIQPWDKEISFISG